MREEMNARLSTLLTLPAFGTVAACGGMVIESGVDGGTAPSSDYDVAGDTGDVGSGSGAVGDCLYVTCAGLSLCGVNKTCPVGDGCNSCVCSDQGGGITASTCTSNACSCH
jgi:hypothetical protein